MRVSLKKRGLRFRGFCSTEVVLVAQAAGFRCVEVPVSYAQRVRESRGLPYRNTGRVIVRVLGDLWRLRGELRQLRSPRLRIHAYARFVAANAPDRTLDGITSASCSPSTGGWYDSTTYALTFIRIFCGYTFDGGRVS